MSTEDIEELDRKREVIEELNRKRDAIVYHVEKVREVIRELVFVVSDESTYTEGLNLQETVSTFDEMSNTLLEDLMKKIDKAYEELKHSEEEEKGEEE